MGLDDDHEPRIGAGLSAAGAAGSGTNGHRPGSHRWPDETALDFLASARRRLGRRAGGAGTGGSEETDPSTVALTQRLTDWRRRLSRASGVPAHVLMHDSTVTAIALRKPASEAELLRCARHGRDQGSPLWAGHPRGGPGRRGLALGAPATDGASDLNADGGRRTAHAVAQCVGEVVRPGK